MTTSCAADADGGPPDAGRADVLVVGAGPVGLTAALALVRGGCTVDLVEARPALASESLAATFHPPTLQILADLGVDLAGHGLPVHTIAYRDTTGGTHVRFDISELAAETAYPHRRHVPQLQVCRLLLDALIAAEGCRIRFGTRADYAMTRRYRWVFAADGAESALRQAISVPFPGQRYAGEVVRLICDRGPFTDWDPVTYIFAEDTSVSVLLMADHARVIVRGDGDAGSGAAEPCAHAAAVAARVTGVEPPVRSWSRYRSQRRAVTANLVDHLIFVGDSAHVTTTRGGMNMNAGIHDAAVLATVLARDPGALPVAAAQRLAVAHDLLLPRTHATLDDPMTRLRGVVDIARDAIARREFLRRASMLDMVAWP